MKNYFQKKLYAISILPLCFVAILWFIFLMGYYNNINLVKFGVLPRETNGLLGIITSIFIHGDLEHIASNSLPIIVLGMLLFFFYKKIAKQTFLWIWLISGTWLWSESPANSTLTSTTGNPTSANNITVNETYTVVATSTAGCTASGSVTVTPGAPLVCGTLTVTGATNCTGVRQVTANPTGGGQPYTYAWKEDGIAYGGNTQSVFTSSGTHTYTCTISDACTPVASCSRTISGSSFKRSPTRVTAN